MPKNITLINFWKSKGYRGTLVMASRLLMSNLLSLFIPPAIHLKLLNSKNTNKNGTEENNDNKQLHIKN